MSDTRLDDEARRNSTIHTSTFVKKTYPENQGHWRLYHCIHNNTRYRVIYTGQGTQRTHAYLRQIDLDASNLN